MENRTPEQSIAKPTCVPHREVAGIARICFTETRASPRAGKRGGDARCSQRPLAKGDILEASMSQRSVRVLVLGESEKGSSYLARFLEQRGCNCWFAKSVEEGLKLFESYKFQLVLSTRPLRLANAMIAQLGESSCSVFHCEPVEDGCWWLPLVDHGKRCFGAPALRPSEFVSALGQIVSEI